MITIRRHPLKFYFTLAFSSLFFFGIPILLFFLASNFGEEEDGTAIIVLLLIALLLVMLGIYMLNIYLKNAPSIQIGNGHISFGKESYPLEDITEVKLEGKAAFPFFIHYPMEAASLTFKDSSVKHIFVDLYSNAWELKSYLEAVVINKGSYQPAIKSGTKQEVNIQGVVQAYKKPQLLSMRGLSVWGLGVYLVFRMGLLENPSTTAITIAAVVFLLWFTIGSWLMHFPSLSSNYLIIKNQNFFWVKDAYKLDHIREVVFETQSRMPNCIRVISTDHRNKLYPAATLWDKNWWEFEEALEKKGIKVRNECVPH
ncbi:MAG: hypothetical protein R8P61_24800 [Bacteroidia bacterium]|nr:hypothetical protein [Bacteroidia bacterium]